MLDSLGLQFIKKNDDDDDDDDDDVYVYTPQLVIYLVSHLWI